MKKMTKREFFKGYEEYWGDITTYCKRMVCWELYNLNINDKNYNHMLYSLPEYGKIRDLGPTEKWLDE